MPSVETLSKLRYKSIHYDPWKNLYYRLVAIPLEIVDKKNYFPYTYEQDFSVLVLDKEFNLLKEVYFPGKTYQHLNIGISKKGLVLMKNNEFYPNLNEDILEVDIFDLSK